MRLLGYLVLGVALVGGTLAPRQAAAQTAAQTAAKAASAPAGPDTVVFQTSRGAVTFMHRTHAAKFDCGNCHHASRPEKPLTAAQEKCGDCHTDPPTPPMKTTLRQAMHNTATGEGTCMNCHNQMADSVDTVPAMCSDCHKRN